MAQQAHSPPRLLQEVILALNKHALPLVRRLGEAAAPGLEVLPLTGLRLQLAEVQRLLQPRTEVQRHPLGLDTGSKGCCEQSSSPLDWSPSRCSSRPQRRQAARQGPTNTCQQAWVPDGQGLTHHGMFNTGE